MKKLFFIAVAAVALTACSNEEDVYVNTGQKEITFNALTQKSSRAIANNATFNDGQTMYVTARYKDGASDYFTNIPYALKDGTWKGTPAQFWPFDNGNTMDFAAYAIDGKNGFNTGSYTFENGKYKDLTLNFSSSELTGVDDVMVSNRVNDIKCPQTDPVDMKFYHALAQLQFTVKYGDGFTYNNDTKNTIQIDAIEVNLPTLTGTVKAEYGDDNVPVFTWTANAPADGSKYNIMESVPAFNPTTTAQPVGNGLLVVPGAMSGEGIHSFASFTITYTIKSGTNTTTETTYVYTPADGSTWEAGKKYTYNIVISPTEIIVTPSVQNYTDGATNPSFSI